MQDISGKHVVFGRVIRGFHDVVKSISEVPVDGKDRPNVPVAISNCGELELRKKRDDALQGELHNHCLTQML
jgi:peptidyl-prolyl isomerase G (cyclophilin G)